MVYSVTAMTSYLLPGLAKLLEILKDSSFSVSGSIMVWNVVVEHLSSDGM